MPESHACVHQFFFFFFFFFAIFLVYASQKKALSVCCVYVVVCIDIHNFVFVQALNFVCVQRWLDQRLCFSA